MRSLVIFESMYGTTHDVADHVAQGLAGGGEVQVVSVARATPEQVRWADLLVVGGPTHIHGMSTGMSRSSATSAETLSREAEKGHDLEVDPDAEGPGLRDWFDGLDAPAGTLAAAFDTRLDANPALTGRASKGITKRLRKHGCTVMEPESFLVDKTTTLLDGEEARAVDWGRTVLAEAQTRLPATDPQ